MKSKICMREILMLLTLISWVLFCLNIEIRLVWPSHDLGLSSWSFTYSKEEMPLLIANAWGYMLLALLTWDKGMLSMLLAGTWMFDFPSLGVTYDSWKSSSSVWFAQLESMLWASMWAEYSIEDALESTDDSLDEFALAMVDLPLGAPIYISSKIPLKSAGLDMAERIVKEFIFTISLLGTTIQDGGMRERSDVLNVVTVLNIL